MKYIHTYIYKYFENRPKSVVDQTINSSHATGLLLYPLKTPENLLFYDIFRGYRKRSVA